MRDKNITGRELTLTDDNFGVWMTSRKDVKDFQIGDFAEKNVKITNKLVETFAELTDDTNPLHLDEAYASRSFFKKRVAHGMLPACFIGAILGTTLPGPGTIYLYQNLRFTAPVYIGDTLTVRVETIGMDEKKGAVKLKTSIRNDRKVLVLDGEAEILFRPAKEDY
jgi:3-hydroxybutyryl-CoA dehydratase